MIRTKVESPNPACGEFEIGLITTCAAAGAAARVLGQG